jgi:hypothetical protein
MRLSFTVEVVSEIALALRLDLVFPVLVSGEVVVPLAIVNGVTTVSRVASDGVRGETAPS